MVLEELHPLKTYPFALKSVCPGNTRISMCSSRFAINNTPAPNPHQKRTEKDLINLRGYAKVFSSLSKHLFLIAVPHAVTLTKKDKYCDTEPCDHLTMWCERLTLWTVLLLIGLGKPGVSQVQAKCRDNTVGRKDFLQYVRLFTLLILSMQTPPPPPSGHLVPK